MSHSAKRANRQGLKRGQDQTRGWDRDFRREAREEAVQRERFKEHIYDAARMVVTGSIHPWPNKRWKKP